MRHILAFGLLAFAINAQAETARIATWNLAGFSPIPEPRLERVVDALAILDADITVLAELNPRTHGRAIAEALSAPDDACYEHTVPDQPRSSMEIGFIYKCDVVVDNPRFVAGSDLGKRGYRSAPAVSVRIDEFDFVLLGLHLKASRGPDPRALRTEQVEIIGAYIQGVLRGGEKDVLVLGDYNMVPGEDAENFQTLNTTGTLRFVSSEDLSGEFTHIGSSGPGKLLDGYAFTTVDPAEYREGSIAVIPMNERLGLTLMEYRSEVSDHLPVVGTFNTGTDHD